MGTVIAICATTLLCLAMVCQTAERVNRARIESRERLQIEAMRPKGELQ